VSRALLAGDAAVLLELDAGRPAALAAAISAARLTGVLDVIPAARTVLVTVEPGSGDVRELARQLAAIEVPDLAPAAAQPATEIEVCYDGPDLADVARLAGLPASEVIDRHQAGQYEVGWLGFAPGFGYLTGLDPALSQVPRLDSPRVAVPAGSVAIAAGLTAVYPAVSPGGWRLIGRTDATLWDSERRPPALLTPGGRVRFRAVPELTGPAPQRDHLGRRPGPAADAPAGLEILQPGPLTTVQDLGRPGLAHLGVPRSGAADADSLRLANALVRNEPGLAALEITLGRLAVRFGQDATVALAGAPAPLRLTLTDGSRSEPPAGAAFDVPAGSVLRLGSPPAGLRSYLAVAGGIEVRPVLGSRSADLRSGLGPAPLRAGQRVAIGSGRPERTAADPRAAAVAVRGPAGSGPGPVELGAVAGPRADWFAAGALDQLSRASYQVTPASDRTGLRLSGPPLHRASPAELPSEGVATGSLQISHDGQPILLLADHPATGGYPVIAVVRSADIGRAAQLRPGQQVRFRLG
jgi:KipI family sensor histidine kinase inhibitor